MPSNAHGLAVCAVLAAATLASVPASASDIEPRLTIVSPDPSVRTVALTLDACSGATDHRILDVLVDESIPATIFVTHRWLKRNPDALKTMLDHPDLFEIENHGDRHIPAVTDVSTVFGLETAGSVDAVRSEVDGGATAIEAAGAPKPHWYRDATARYSRDAIDAIKADGYAIAGYSLNADMGASLMGPLVARRVEAAKSGDVIIAHVNQPGRASGEGLAQGVRALKTAGVRFVRLNDVETEGGDGLAELVIAAARRRPNTSSAPAASPAVTPH